MQDKKGFIKSFFPESVENLQLLSIDLEITGLTLCDILRNINKTFPTNSKDRYDIKDGTKVVAVICKSELISPLSGIILIVGNSKLTIHTESRNYVLISIDEKDISDEDVLDEINTDIILYLAKLMRGKVEAFDEFLKKSLYNDYEDLGE